MLSNDEINKIYKQYINDLQIQSTMPTIIPRPNFNIPYLAQVKEITSDIFEISLGKKLCSNKLNKKYTVSVLYHEFTHVYDQIHFFRDIRDKRTKTNLLYPYTEYHAAQIQMKKLLELYYNPSKQVTRSTTIYDETGVIPLNVFNEIQNEQFDLRLQSAKQNYSKHEFNLLMYHIIYNVGFYSTYKQYGLFDDIFIFHLPFDYIQNQMNNLIEKLMNSKPSNDLCLEVNKLTNQITSSIFKNEL